MQLTLSETWVSGNLTALTERSQRAIRWRYTTNRVSCGSFRGGHWYLPIRNHDNRYFADWIRLCPGLSKNSENGNSCPKPHKAGILNMDSIKEKLTALQRKNYYMETKMDRESSLQNWNAFTRPKDKTILSFSGSPTQWPWQGCCCNLPRKSNAVRHSCVPPPPYRHYRHSPSLDYSPSFALIRWPGQAGLTSTGLEAAGPDGCLLGRIHFLCGYVVYVLLCCWGVFPVLTLYSPRSIVWGLFFFSSLSSCLCCIFLQFYLHFTTDYTLYDCVCDE